MWKALLLRLAFGLVLDILIAVVNKKHTEAPTSEAKRPWLFVLEFLISAKADGLGLLNAKK